MNPKKALWDKGDFNRIAASMRESGEALVKGLGITRGIKVLDLECGDGTTALPQARLGADVLGVDIAMNLHLTAAALVPPLPREHVENAALASAPAATPENPSARRLPDWVTLEELAEIIGCDDDTLHGAVAYGHLLGADLREDGRLHVARDAVHAWLVLR